MKVRDSQRSKVYRAEREGLAKWWRTHNTVTERGRGWSSSYSWTDGNGKGERLETMDEVQAFVNRILRSRWYKSYRVKLPVCDSDNGTWRNDGPPWIEVADGRGRRKAGGSRGYITMPKWSRCRVIVLHEMAHAIQTERPGHGRQFARIYLDLVTRWIGKEAGAALRAAFAKHRVRYRKKTTRVLTPIQRQRFEEFIAARRQT